MPHENVQVVHAAIDAVNRGDPEAFMACLDPEVVWDDTEGWAGLRGVYRGPAEVRDWFQAALVEPWDSLEIAAEEIAEASDGERVSVEGSVRARGRTSGAEADIRVWQVLWLRGGRITRRELYWTRDEAAEAAGLGE
jgi:ketosteroid isomerase-like protein